MNVFLEESQRNSTSCLPEMFVPCSKIAAEQPTTAAQNHRLKPTVNVPASQLLSCPQTAALFQILLAANKNIQQHISIPGKNLPLF
jgi:hypothetical protein